MERLVVLLGFEKEAERAWPKGSRFTCVAETARPRLPKRGRVNLLGAEFSISGNYERRGRERERGRGGECRQKGRREGRVREKGGRREGGREEERERERRVITSFLHSLYRPRVSEIENVYSQQGNNCMETLNIFLLALTVEKQT